MNNYRLIFSAILLVPTLSLSPTPLSLAGTVRIYVTNSTGNSLHVIDPSINAVVQEIKGVVGAHAVAFSPDCSRVYVSNEMNRSLDVFDRETGTLVTKIPLSARPNNIAVASDGRIVIGIAEEPGTLDILDPTNLTRTKGVPVNGPLHNVYITPDNKYVVTGSPRTGVITVIDLGTEQPIWELKLGAGIRPMAIERASDGSAKRLFVQLSDFNGFAVVDFAARKEVARIELPQSKTAFDVDPGRADAPSHGIAVAPDGRTLWVASTRNNAVYGYSLMDLKLVSETSLPSIALPDHKPITSFPNWMTFTPDSKMLYVTNSDLRLVSVIDTQLSKVIALIHVGDGPKRINTLAIPN